MSDLKYQFYDMVNIISEQLRGIYLSDILLVVLVSLLLLFLVKALMLKRGENMSVGQGLMYFLTFAYAGVILLITILRRDPGSRSVGINVHIYFGLLKGGWLSTKQAVYSILNVLLFVPWGFLLRMYRREGRNARAVCMTVLAGFLTTFCVEIIQYVTGRGRFEVTDLVTNVTGTLAGALIGTLVVYITQINKQEKQDE